MAPNVGWRTTVEAVVLVPHGADVSELGVAHDTVVRAARERLHDSDPVVRWAVVDDGVEYRAVVTESTGTAPPGPTYRGGTRDGLGDIIDANAKQTARSVVDRPEAGS